MQRAWTSSTPKDKMQSLRLKEFCACSLLLFASFVLCVDPPLEGPAAITAATAKLPQLSSEQSMLPPSASARVCVNATLSTPSLCLDAADYAMPEQPLFEVAAEITDWYTRYILSYSIPKKLIQASMHQCEVAIVFNGELLQGRTVNGSVSNAHECNQQAARVPLPMSQLKESNQIFFIFFDKPSDSDLDSEVAAGAFDSASTGSCSARAGDDRGDSSHCFSWENMSDFVLGVSRTMTFPAAAVALQSPTVKQPGDSDTSSDTSRTSATDVAGYRQDMASAMTNETMFSILRSRYSVYVAFEHMLSAHGSRYLRALQRMYPEALVEYRRRFGRWDDWGQAPSFEYDATGGIVDRDAASELSSEESASRHHFFNPVTLRYVFFRYEIETLLGRTLDGLRIAEIGAGLGGQAFICHVDRKPMSYTTFDLPEVAQVTGKAVRRLLTQDRVSDSESESVNNFNSKADSASDSDSTRRHPGRDRDVDGRLNFATVDGTDETNVERIARAVGEFDLVISNYAFSELADNVWQMYARHVVSRSSHGFMIINRNMGTLARRQFTNFLTDELGRAVYWEREWPETFPVNERLWWQPITTA